MTALPHRPRKGTLAQRLIEFLEGAAPGAKLTIDEISAQFGVKPESVVTVLRASYQAGLLDFSKVVAGAKAVRAYHLPVEPTEGEEEPVGPLAINHDSTGDLWFSGFRTTNTGDVLLNPKQLQQLVNYATTAPVALQPVEVQS